MKSNRATMSLLSYTVVHFMVDFACLYYLMGTFSLYKFTGIGIATGFLLYNTIAFGLQFIIGWFYDGRRYSYAGIIGILLVMAGTMVDTVLPMICKDSFLIEMENILGIPYSIWLIIVLVLLALGNAFFHVAGGMDSLINSNGKMRRCGIFVSSGALGVALGSYAGENALLDGFSILCALFVGFGLILVYGDVDGERIEVGQRSENPRYLLPALLCFLAIVLRGYLGTIMTSSFSILFLAAVATCFGKFMGGILADEFGAKSVGLISLIIAAVCFSGVVQGPLIALIGIVCFNLAMPITYFTLYESFYYHPGVACGLNCLALLVGTSISAFVTEQEGKSSFLLVAGMLTTALLVFLSAPGRKRLHKESLPSQVPEEVNV